MAREWMRCVWTGAACASLLLPACDEDPRERDDPHEMAVDASRPDAAAEAGTAGTKAPPRRTTTHYCLPTREAVRRAEASGADPTLDMDAGDADTDAAPLECPESQPATVFCSRVKLMSVDQDLCCYVETSSTEC